MYPKLVLKKTFQSKERVSYYVSLHEDILKIILFTNEEIKGALSLKGYIYIYIQIYVSFAAPLHMDIRLFISFS